MLNNPSFFQQVYAAVSKIPEGSVVTYGDIARAVGTADSRRVGQALHANRAPETPCHRVVFSDGSLAPNYAFGGAGKQRERLEKEGVRFTSEGKVDFKECRAAFLIS